MNKPIYKSVTCKKCGWVHFEVSLKDAFKSVKQFNAYYDTLTKKEQKDYYGGKKASIINYLTCDLCGGLWKNFRAFKKDDCPRGCTLGPIVSRKDDI